MIPKVQASLVSRWPKFSKTSVRVSGVQSACVFSFPG